MKNSKSLLATSVSLVAAAAACVFVAAAPAHAQVNMLPTADTYYPLAPAIEAPKVVIDVSDSPESKAWADKAQVLAREWFPVIWRMMGTENQKPPKQIKLVFRKKQDAPAYESNNEISVNGQWIAAHPDDLGMIIHEMTHIVQSYGGGGNKPGWLVEGIADFIRWWRYEPEAPRSRIDPFKNTYHDSYRITAAFLAWISYKYDKGIVPKLDRALRDKTYSDDIFKTSTGKDLDTLWAEFAPKPATPPTTTTR